MLADRREMKSQKAYASLVRHTSFIRNSHHHGACFETGDIRDALERQLAPELDNVGQGFFSKYLSILSASCQFGESVADRLQAIDQLIWTFLPPYMFDDEVAQVLINFSEETRHFLMNERPELIPDQRLQGHQ